MPKYNYRHKEDIDFGKKREVEILSELRILFQDETITKTIGYIDLFDYTGRNKMIELKSRRCASDTYLTTIISMCKLEYCALNPDINYYFVFYYLDDILFCKYDKEDFDLFEKKTISRRDRGMIETDLYCCIPIQYLSPFKSTSRFL